eukprot:scaffold5682_cov140-Cylindrotheca_fusiformis.AAC.15
MSACSASLRNPTYGTVLRSALTVCTFSAVLFQSNNNHNSQHKIKGQQNCSLWTQKNSNDIDDDSEGDSLIVKLLQSVEEIRFRTVSGKEKQEEHYQIQNELVPNIRTDNNTYETGILQPGCPSLFDRVQLARIAAR